MQKYLVVSNIICNFALGNREGVSDKTKGSDDPLCVTDPFQKLIRGLIGLWCNGNTTVFGAVFLGSTPSNPTMKEITLSVIEKELEKLLKGDGYERQIIIPLCNINFLEKLDRAIIEEITRGAVS